MISANVAKVQLENRRQQIEYEILKEIQEDKMLAPLFEWIYQKIQTSIRLGASSCIWDKVEMHSTFPFTKNDLVWLQYLEKLGYFTSCVEFPKICMLRWSDF
jgi:hypothetical protein